MADHHRPPFQPYQDPRFQSPGLGSRRHRPPSVLPSLELPEECGGRGGAEAAPAPVPAYSPASGGGGSGDSSGGGEYLSGGGGTDRGGGGGGGGWFWGERGGGEDGWGEAWEEGGSGSGGDEVYGRGDGAGYGGGVFYGGGCEGGEAYTQADGGGRDDGFFDRYPASDARIRSDEYRVEPSRVQSGGYQISGPGHFGGEDEDFEIGSPGLDPPEAQPKPGTWVGPSARDVGPGAGEGASRAGAGVGGRETQRLDSFFEAFFSLRRFSKGPHGNGTGGGGFGFDGGVLDFLESSAATGHAASPGASALPPHPPPLPHLFPLVLSPPPTPLPPPSLSPPKPDPSLSDGLSQTAGGDSYGAVQFYPPSLQPRPCAVTWKLPFPHWLHQPGEPGVADGNAAYAGPGPSHSYHQEAGLTAPFVASPPPPPPRPSSLHPASLPSHTPRRHQPTGQRGSPYMASQEAAGGHFGQSHSQTAASTVLYRGTPFPSILQRERGPGAGHYTPPPMLDPLRRTAGLFSSLSSLHHGRQRMTRTGGEDWGRSLLSCINVGPEFQADVPCYFLEEEEPGMSGAWSDELPWEELLWQPWEELEESPVVQDQVEKLLCVCSSSCMPGGGTNMELVLHCLHFCQGDTLATLQMLLFSQTSPAGDYHYTGSDVWSVCERSLFFKALEIHGKDFSLIQSMVRTRSVCQCVEFYQLCKRLPEKQQRWREEEERGMEEEEKARVVLVSKPMGKQLGLEGVVPAPSLASCFPCKQCGKMFYKIKSRNAHMKIHRQTHEDWGDRTQQHQLLTQRLALNLAQNLAPALGSHLLQPQASAAYHPGNHNNHAVVPGQNAVTVNNAADSAPNYRGPAPLLPVHQAWNSFAVTSDPTTFYYDLEGKASVGVATGTKGPIMWQ